MLAALARRGDAMSAVLPAVDDDAVAREVVGEQDRRLGQIVGHDQIETEVVRCLARRDLGPHGQAGRVYPQVALGREATARAAETLPRSPPFAPAA